MADKKDLDYTYTTIDRIFRLSIGEQADFSGAKYDGDFSLSLEAAQRAKHQFIVENLHLRNGSKVLDMGCGWGPFLNFATKEIGAACIGLTLSEGQANACRNNGFNVHIKDCKTITPDDFGTFDAVVSLGAFEHFCSVEEWKAGKQEAIYEDYFKRTAALLPPGGRFFLQTMTFGKNMIDPSEINIHAKKGSAAHALAYMMQEFPGSWLPYGSEMIVRNAEPHLKLISKSSGRLDYIETLHQWRKRFLAFNWEKYGLFFSKYLTSNAFRKQVSVFLNKPNLICFQKEILDHYRMVLERV